ncbi:LamG domain-containing protein [Aporhodopirellula aestuarii]|uniref:LamG domain-containing protein n=1 Tax=Aporhodopirellula aestuarii TaxID=2950107 RepID=A0ABT0UBE0_9BACT|nr:LamG domain-containing protein [Aporhodopirellula aestuarii]MCM2374189.1 LamG domain-containing protein [Aporhodopirellula aestuarii]
MAPDNDDLSTLRRLILKSQQESLSDSESEQANRIAQSKAGSKEAVAMIDQLCAFSEFSSLDSPSLAKDVFDVLREQPDPPVKAAVRRVPTALRNVVAVSPSAPSTASSPKSSNYLWILSLVASNILVASLAWSLAGSLSKRQPVGDIVTQAVSPQLVSMTACVWSSSDDSVPAIGQPIPTGEVLSLVEGIAEVRFGDDATRGAVVRIEGPASVQIRDNGELRLLRGSLTLDSFGSDAETLTIDTTIGRVLVAGQSSIGLVSDDIVSEVHVFTGSALLNPRGVTFETEQIRLIESEAVRVFSTTDMGSQLVRFAASKSSFVSARSAGFDALKIGDDYVKAVKQSEPGVYWRFEQLHGENPFYIENEGSIPGMNAVIVGNPTWRQYGNNRVAEVGTARASAFRALETWPEEPLGEYSVELWVKPQLYHHGEVICLHEQEELEDGRHQHTMMLEVTTKHHFTHRLSDSAPNRFRFVHRQLGAPQPISATSLFAEQPYEPRVWQHVVAQKKGDRQLLWVNGQIAAERINPVPLSKNVQILVGQVYPNSEYRRFAGQIDEIAIYDRALSSQEIRTHIRAAGRSIAPKREATDKDSGTTSP